MEPVTANPPLAGSNTSADARIEPLNPPAINTLPFGSRVALWPRREVDISPALENLPVAGSKISAVPRLAPSNPPAMRTFPFPSRVALCSLRDSAGEWKGSHRRRIRWRQSRHRGDLRPRNRQILERRGNVNFPPWPQRDPAAEWQGVDRRRIQRFDSRIRRSVRPGQRRVRRHGLHDRATPASRRGAAE